MNRRNSLLLILLAVLLFTSVAVWGQTSSNYNLEWHVVAGGGGQSSSASYVVNGTIGQSAASPPQPTSATYVVSSGFWLSRSVIYLPTIMKP